MIRRVYSRRFGPLFLGILALAMSPRAAWPQSPPESAPSGLPAPPVPADLDAAGLASLKRTIRIFDFEEAEHRLVEFPDSFYRRSDRDGASAEGFPPFGAMTLARDEAYTGNWSFKFQLNGGSMSARTFRGSIPILPEADYAVTIRVLTSGLVHARARLVAWLADIHGNAIPESRAESGLTQTAGLWETISVELLGEHPRAADLIVELQVLQPRQFLPRGADFDQPILDDFSGAVWFDDLRILHMPRAELTLLASVSGGGGGAGSAAPAVAGGIIRRPDLPQLNLLVRDHASAPLTCNLYVFDVGGALVHADKYGPARGQQRKSVTLPLRRCGWYRAVLLVHSDGRLTGRRWLDFAIVSRDTRSLITARSRFGVVLGEQSPARLESAAELVRGMQVGHVLLPVWTRNFANPDQVESYERLRRAIAPLLEADLRLTIALNEIPQELSQALGLDPSQVLDMFGEPPATWRPFLESMLVNFGLEVRRWQIGATGSTEYASNPALGEKLRTARAVLGTLAANPQVSIPWPAEYALPAAPPVDAVHISVPHQVQSDALGEYIGHWSGASDQVVVTLEPLPQDVFGTRDQIVDLMIRALRTWRTNVQEIAIAAPWVWTRRHGDRLEIQPTYPVWRTLADRLNGRRYGGSLVTEPGVHAWILEGLLPADAALVVWTDRSPAEPAAPMTLLLGHGRIQSIDAFGNATDVPLSDGLHVISPADEPQFIEGINLELARFRSAFALESSFIPAMNRAHPHEFIVHNPWKQTISGELTLTDTAELQISPRSIPFTIRAGATVRLPVQVVVGRNVLAGPKTITADASIVADRDYRITVRTRAEVGLPDVAFAASWSQARNVQTGERELVVTETVTNTGSQVLNLDVFVMAADLPVQKRRLPPLAPGESATRHFVLGPELDAIIERVIRVGVEERSGAVRLNRLLAIPVSAPSESRASADQ